MTIWTARRISIKENSVLFTRQLKPPWTIKRFHNSLKAKDSLINKTLVALILEEKLFSALRRMAGHHELFIRHLHGIFKSRILSGPPITKEERHFAEMVE